MPWGMPDIIDITPRNAVADGWSPQLAPKLPWVVEQKSQQAPEFADNEDLKKKFGIELAKDQYSNPFEAACAVFKDANAASWVSFYWLNDPIVIGARDAYSKTLKSESSLLDKNAFAARLLELVDEKDAKTKTVHVVDAKDRIAALKLYAEVMGFVGKEAAIQNTIVNNNEGLKVVFVEAPKDVEPSKIINVAPIKSEMTNDDKLPFKVKMVG